MHTHTHTHKNTATDTSTAEYKIMATGSTYEEQVFKMTKLVVNGARSRMVP